MTGKTGTRTRDDEIVDAVRNGARTTREIALALGLAKFEGLAVRCGNLVRDGRLAMVAEFYVPGKPEAKASDKSGKGLGRLLGKRHTRENLS